MHRSVYLIIPVPHPVGLPQSQAREEDGKRPDQGVIDKMAWVSIPSHWNSNFQFSNFIHRALNIHAMRMGPGKHLRGLTLMGGIVSPEEFDYFHEVVIRPCVKFDIYLILTLHLSSLSLKSLFAVALAVTEMACPILSPSMHMYLIPYIQAFLEAK
jgi:hypothetical protein